MGFPTNSVWSLNPDAVTRLEELVVEGLSAGEIAEALTGRFEITFTRSQIMGKAKRLRLSFRRAQIRAEMEAEKLREMVTPPEPKRSSKFNPVVRTRKHYVEPSFPPPAPPIHNGKGYRFWDVPRNGCMFEISSVDAAVKDFRFCGRPRHPGEAYCERHFEVTISPAQYKLKLKGVR